MKQTGILILTLIFVFTGNIEITRAFSFPTGDYPRGKEIVYNIDDFGAQSGSSAINTEAIQEAVDSCASEGGGVVFIPSELYITGSVRLKSNVTLYLNQGAVLKGSPNLEDYTKTEYESESRTRSLIYAFHGKNISLAGDGMIHGNDSSFMQWDAVHQSSCCMIPKYTRQGESYRNRMPDGPAKPTERPGALITFIECRDISVRDISLHRAPNWCLHMACCEGVQIQGITVRNSLLVPNADGIDVSKCENVTIDNCNIHAGDDGIAIGTCADGYCSHVAQNIHVSNCNIRSRSAGIRLGWSTDDIRDCTFRQLTIHSNRGIGLFVRHNEIIENILFSDISIYTRLHTGWWGNGESIHISEIPLGELHGLSSEGKKHGQIKNIRFSNIIANAEHGMVCYGHHTNSLKNISFDRIDLNIHSSPLNESYGGNFDLRPAFDMKYGVFEHEIPGLFCKNINGLNISEFSLQWAEDMPHFFTHGVACYDCSEVDINGFEGKAAHANGEKAALAIFNTNGVSLKNSTAAQGTGVFFRHKKVEDARFFTGNDIRNARKGIFPEAELFRIRTNNMINR
jgi:hypothetical protein